MTSCTLGEFLSAHAANGGMHASAVAETVLALARGALAVRDAVALSPRAGVVPGAAAGTPGAGGDIPHELDLRADVLLLDAVRSAPVAAYASEETKHPTPVNHGAPLAIATDPLDGSSNIDANGSIGTIFSLLPALDGLGSNALESFLQAGARQLAAGFFLYGPQLALALSVGKGTDIFMYSPDRGAFVRVYPNVTVPHATQEFAVNAANYRHWDNGVRHYYDDCLKGAAGPHGRDFNMRWVASVVADAYRILVRGGIYMYPADAREGYASGRLRLVYEANPIAMLIEQAGGLATDGTKAILERTPTALHERVPLVFGSRREVLQVARYAEEHDSMGLRSPLFGARGLFRN